MIENSDKSGKVFRISISVEKGDKKENVSTVRLVTGGGIDGDAHASSNRPVSLLPYESFVKVEHPNLDVQPGDFAENITTTGIDYSQFKIGTKLQLGDSVHLEVIQIGKECHHGCYIREAVGDCIMPREGIFAKVLTGGELRQGDAVLVL